MHYLLRRNSEYIFWFIHVPLLVVVGLVSVYVWSKRRSVIRECHQTSQLNLSGDELMLHKKNLKITRYTINILLFIVSIEFLPNALAVVSDIAKHFISIPQNYSITNSCRLVYVPDITHFYPVWIPAQLSISVHMLLIPALCFLLKFLFRAYLCHDYTPVVRHWLLYLLVRFTCLLLILNISHLYWFFLLLQACIYITDYCVYLLYAYRFYKVLQSRRNEAKLHCGPEEHYQRAKILKRYSVSIRLVSVLVTMLVLEVVLVNLMDLLNLVILNNCYFHVISYSLIPVVRMPDRLVALWTRIEQDADMIWLCVSILRKSLLMWLYSGLLLVNSVQCFVRCRGVRLKELVVPLLSRKYSC